MTRVNLVPPAELADQHLFAEYRELKMIPKSLARSIAARGIDGIPAMISESFTLNKGHVSFFYDKGAYLQERFELLKAELLVRGYTFNEAGVLDENGVYAQHPHLNGMYSPTVDALRIIRERIAERIALRPNWYKMHGKPL